MHPFKTFIFEDAKVIERKENAIVKYFECQSHFTCRELYPDKYLL